MTTHLSETPTMFKPSKAPRKKLGALPALLSLGLSALSLSACRVDDGSSDPIAATDYHMLHPIVLAQAPTTVDIFAPAGRLDEQSAASIRAFADQISRIRNQPDRDPGALFAARRQRRDDRRNPQGALCERSARQCRHRFLSGGGFGHNRAGAASFPGLGGQGAFALREVAGRFGVGRQHQGVEQSGLRELWLRDAVDACCADRRSPRPRASARRDRARRRNAPARHRRRPEGNGSRNIVEDTEHSDRASWGKLTNGRAILGRNGRSLAPFRHANSADRSGSPGLHPGVLRNVGRRDGRSGRDRRSTHEQGSRQAEHGRRRGGGGGLSQFSDAERHHSRGHRQQGRTGRSTRRAVAILRRRHQSHHSGQGRTTSFSIVS